MKNGQIFMKLYIVSNQLLLCRSGVTAKIIVKMLVHVIVCEYNNFALGLEIKIATLAPAKNFCLRAQSFSQMWSNKWAL